MNRAGWVLSVLMTFSACACGSNSAVSDDDASQGDEPVAASSGASAVVQNAPGALGGPIKWHPGHYVASNGAHKLGTNATIFGPELDAACKEPNVRGWRGIYDWAALEPQLGRYDFSAIDAELVHLKGCASSPKRLGALISPGAFGHTVPDPSVLPQYLLTNSIYGKGADGVHFGYWNTSSSYAAALWRRAVSDRFIALIQALGARYDSEPFFEVVMLPEVASVVLPAPDFSGGALLAEQERLVAAAVAAFPNTNVSIQNNYMATLADTGALLNFTATHRAAQNGPDIFGNSAIVKYGNKVYTWGQQCLLGLGTDPGCKVDLRGHIPIIHDIQEPEMDGTQFRGIGSPFTPLDLYTTADTNLHANHVFWTWLGGSGPGNWSSVAAMIDAHPVTHTACPTTYVTGCNTK